VTYRVFTDDPGRVAQYVTSKNGGVFEGSDFPSVGLERNGQIVAGVLYDGYLERSICIHVAADKLTREFVRFCFYYPFIQLGVGKLIGLVDSSNLPAMRFNWHLGFTVEAVIRDGAKFGDLCLFTMTPDQCKWLNVGRRTGEKHGRQEQQTRFA
jgi:hypothetical protein